MKLIIDIPEEDYKTIIQRPKQCVVHWDIVDALRDGTPLDDVRAEIEGYRLTIDRAISEDELKIKGMKEAYTDCLEIIDNIGKAESEDT